MDYHFSSLGEMVKYLHGEGSFTMYGRAASRAISVGGFCTAAACCAGLAFPRKSQASASPSVPPHPLPSFGSALKLIPPLVVGFAGPIVAAYAVRAVVWCTLLGHPRLRSPTAWLVMGVRLVPATTAGSLAAALGVAMFAEFNIGKSLVKTNDSH
eukprot:RCo026906